MSIDQGQTGGKAGNYRDEIKNNVCNKFMEKCNELLENAEDEPPKISKVMKMKHSAAKEVSIKDQKWVLKLVLFSNNSDNFSDSLLQTLQEHF